jgi:FkbM family methyltransferase
MGVLNYEPADATGERAFVKRYLQGRSDAVVFDVGANVGRYSAEVLQLSPSATVYAFEPHPKTFAALKANISDPRLHAINVAVGERSGVASLFDYKTRDGSSHASVHRGVIEEIHKAAPVEHAVNVISLEEYAAENDIEHVDLLKIDTEGGELDALKGFRRYIEAGKVGAVQFEFNEMNVLSRAYFHDFWNLMPGYDFYRLLPGGMIRFERYVPVLCEIFAFQNIVALRRQ